jgi:cell wall-associated NlpC family hydrolase
MSADRIVTRLDVVRSLEKILGQPYAHQGRLQEVGGRITGPGTDCCGTLLFAGHDLGVTSFEMLGYAADPDGSFEQILESQLIRLPHFRDAQVGDVLAHDFGEGIQHCSVVVSVHPTRRDWQQFKVIHATRSNGVHRGVFELKYYKALVRAYHIPGVQY